MPDNSQYTVEQYTKNKIDNFPNYNKIDNFPNYNLQNICKIYFTKFLMYASGKMRNVACVFYF